jgi:hypothetical protein
MAPMFLFAPPGQAVGQPMSKLPVVVVLALLSAACSAKQQAPPEWVKTRSSAEGFESAYAKCKRGAVEKTDSAANETAASAEAVVQFFMCMSNKGWQRAPGPNPASRK